MDHRCLYGHRVPAAFTFAIQSRSCPTCGAPTVTVNGYQAARKLATEAGLDGVAAFHALRVIEADWVLSPAATAAPVVAPTPGPALGTPELASPGVAAAPSVPEEEEVVIEDVAEPATAPSAAVVPPPVLAAAAEAPPEPRITARVKPDKERPRPEPRVEPVVTTPAPSAGPSVTPSTGPAFGKEEEDFFKGA